MPPKVVRRPVKRPAARGGARKRHSQSEKPEDEDVKESTSFQLFSEVDLRTLPQIGGVVMQEATYYGRTCPTAGHFVGLSSEGDNVFARLKVSGTKHEELLRVLSGKRERVVQVHLCEEGCTGQLSDEVLLHSQGFEPVDLQRVPWLTNLQAVQMPEEADDEMAALRAERERLEKESKDKSKKEEKKMKKKKKRGEADEMRRSKSPREEAEDLEVGQRPLELIFKNTGMDPDPVRRAKVLKRARRLGKMGKKKKKKKDKSSSTSNGASSSSSTATSDEDYGADGLFEEEKHLRAIWKKCPGALAARSIQEIKRNLVSSAGTLWEVNKAALPPLYTQYGRQVVMTGMSASLQQETLTLCQGLDPLARGSVASCMDLLNQRLKSLEALGRGAHWSYCRQHELVRVEEGGMTEEQERLSAARRAREEERLKGLIARPQGGKGAESSQGGKTRKGKEKGTHKGQAGDGNKGKGNQGGREDAKAGWPKKTDK
eukprot:s548_g30.t1